MSGVWLGLGSNIGDREGHLRSALSRLAGILTNIRQAPIYETEARDYQDQGDFLNTVITGETELSPRLFLAEILSIEGLGGRVRAGLPLKGPRTIDIDILLWNGRIIDEKDTGTGGLIVPHPRMTERLFVLKPLLDLDPNILDPRDGVSFQEKASHLLDQPVKLYRHE